MVDCTEADSSRGHAMLVRRQKSEGKRFHNWHLFDAIFREQFQGKSQSRRKGFENIRKTKTPIEAIRF